MIFCNQVTFKILLVYNVREKILLQSPETNIVAHYQSLATGTANKARVPIGLAACYHYLHLIVIADF